MFIPTQKTEIVWRYESKNSFAHLFTEHFSYVSGTLSAKDSKHVPAFMNLVIFWDRIQPNKQKDLMFRITKKYKSYKERS